MDPLTITLSQIQFAVTSVYEFFFVPLTVGLSLLVAIMESLYVRTGKDTYKQMTKFWGKLFIINFAMGVVTGLVQEFQFGMNWSEYSRYVGDIFGAPLAIEALLAFFLESTFLGIWVFGWDKLSKGLHAVAIWLVAIGTNVSAFWILVANSFMQSPAGFVEENGRLVMNRFSELLTNEYLWGQFPHTVFSGFTTAGFFVVAISAYHLVRSHQVDIFKQSFKIGTIFATTSIILVGLVGHTQTQQIVRLQPMKIAAAEALTETEDPASLSLFSIVDQKTLQERVSIRIPYLLSFLSFNRPSGEVRGLVDLQLEAESLYGPGNYVPSVFIAYWAFRAMVGVGFLLLAIAAYALYSVIRKKVSPQMKFLKFFPFVAFLPYIATTTGWLLTETGRQPWVVYTKMRTVEAISPNLTPGMVLTSLIGFTLIYALLMAADVYLLAKYAKAGIEPVDSTPAIEVTQE